MSEFKFFRKLKLMVLRRLSQPQITGERSRSSNQIENATQMFFTHNLHSFESCIWKLFFVKYVRESHKKLKKHADRDYKFNFSASLEY